jgi:hypothetical protein
LAALEAAVVITVVHAVHGHSRTGRDPRLLSQDVLGLQETPIQIQLIQVLSKLVATDLGK